MKPLIIITAILIGVLTILGISNILDWGIILGSIIGVILYAGISIGTIYWSDLALKQKDYFNLKNAVTLSSSAKIIVFLILGVSYIYMNKRTYSEKLSFLVVLLCTYFTYTVTTILLLTSKSKDPKIG